MASTLLASDFTVSPPPIGGGTIDFLAHATYGGVSLRTLYDGLGAPALSISTTLADDGTDCVRVNNSLGEDGTNTLTLGSAEGCCGDYTFSYTVTVDDSGVVSSTATVTVAFPACDTGSDTGSSTCCSPYTPEAPPTVGSQTCLPESVKQRVILTTTHVLHVQQGTDARCIKIQVERVVKCMAGCDLDETSYCWPLGTPIALLPPGTYDIYIPAQSAYPLADGTELETTVWLEPVGDDFVRILATINCGSEGCC